MSKGTRKKSFREFQTEFYAAFEDPSVFDCLEFNLLKVVQDGLKVGYSFATNWGLPLPLMMCLQWLRRWQARIKGASSPFSSHPFASLRHRSYLLLDPGRCVKTPTGQWTSLYFHRWREQLPAEDQVFALEREGVSSPLPYDFCIDSYLAHLHFLPFSQEDRQLYRALQNKLQEWQSSTRFQPEALQQIRRALQIFWNQYRVWNWLIREIQPEQALFTCHYHKEGLILALKRNGVKAIELQHGLIAEEDIFYVYPPSIASVAPRALFADEIQVYGSFWREVLLQGSEYAPGQIKVGGYYLYQKERDHEFIARLKQRAKGKPILLITTQKLLYQVFIDYVEWLVEDCASKGIDGLIIVKPHPGNPEGTYAALSRHASVLVSREDLYDLFSASDLHLSIYSTTLYEATRLGLTNFSLFIESCADYVENIIANGIARQLNWGENPFLQNDSEGSSLQPQEFFAPFSLSNPNTISS